MDSKHAFSESNAPLLDDHSECRKVVGKLFYLTITRPDISYDVQTLTQYMTKPNTNHLVVIHKLLRYIKCTVGQGLLYPTTNNFTVKAFADSDWEGALRLEEV